MTSTPITTSIELLMNQTASELADAITAYNQNRNSENLKKMRELQTVLEGAIELAESRNIIIK